MPKFPSVTMKDHSLGLVTVSPAHLIPDGATPSCQNVDFTLNLGAITKRKGISIEYTAETVAGFSEVSGIGQAIFTDGTDKVVASAGDQVFSLTAPGTWTEIYTETDIDGTPVRFAMFNDLLIIVNENITTSKWSGSGSASALLGTPPANVKYVAVHKGKVFMANSSAGKNRLHYSVTDDPEDWTTTTGSTASGFIDIDPDDGDVITGIVSVGSVLVIAKQYKLYLLHGSSADNFSVQPIRGGGVGCIAPDSLVSVEGLALFMSDRGVYGINFDGQLTQMDVNIQNTIRDLPSAARSGAAGGVYRNQYWIAYDSDADGANDSAYVLDYVLGIWTRYTNIQANVFLTLNTGVLLSGGSDSVIIREHNDTDDDEGSAIDMRWESKATDFGSFAVDKEIQEIYVSAKAIANKTLTSDVIVDGDEKDEDQSIALDATGSNTYVYSADWIPEHIGRYIQVKLSNSETSAPVVIYEILLSAIVREREGT